MREDQAVLDDKRAVPMSKTTYRLPQPLVLQTAAIAEATGNSQNEVAHEWFKVMNAQWLANATPDQRRRYEEALKRGQAAAQQEDEPEAPPAKKPAKKGGKP
ncbi:hypothetical protein HUA75_35145 [Myxococcus sp. CA040A]|nr:hypothetical protein [Myxococcus sp. CA040A]